MKPHSLPQTCVTAMTISILFTITANPTDKLFVTLKVNAW